MDKHQIKLVLDGLKSTSSSRIQEALIKIKNKVITNAAGIRYFRDCGGLEYLVPHLRKPNERILDISLSILGNVCLEEESSLLVGKLNIYGSLITILKTVNRDSIVGRACRLIGNLAQRRTNAEALHSHGAIMALINLIDQRDKNTSYPTLTMAVRAIRQLWMIIDKRDEMLGFNAVYTVSMLLSVECESAGIIKSANQDKISDQPKKSQEELIIGILKCLGYFTTYPNPQCAEQVQGDGRGYQCLVALTNTYESLALKCLMNLCYLSKCRPLLGTAGFVECLVGILQKCSESSLWPDGAVKALAHISQDAVNRARLRHCGGLGLLVTAARNHTHAMPALLQYFYDEAGLQILINEGLVGLLTEKLLTYLNTMEYEHKVEQNTPPTVISSKSNQNNTGLFKRRRKQHCPEDPEKLKVLIESDNMMIGFLDNAKSDATDDSESDTESLKGQKFLRSRKRSKTSRRLACLTKERLNIKIMYPDEWTNAALEWPSTQSPPVMSPNRLDNCPVSPYSDSNKSAFSPEYKGSSSKRPRWDWSPESGFSTGEGSSTSPSWVESPWSPGSSTSPNSPFSVIDNSSDSEISGRYSPVCSEVDAEAEVENGGTGGLSNNNVVVDVTHDFDDLIVDDEEDCSLKEEVIPAELESAAKSSSIDCILILLFLVSGERNLQELITGKECINALLDYLERCKRPFGRAAQVLARIFRVKVVTSQLHNNFTIEYEIKSARSLPLHRSIEPMSKGAREVCLDSRKELYLSYMSKLHNVLCLMGVLKHRFALRIQKMSMTSKHPRSRCVQCKQIMRLSTKYLNLLSNLAESSYGIGEISHQLLKGSSYMKRTLSLTLPHLVSSERPLKKFYIDCNALNFLLQIIDKSEEEIELCVLALTKLATNVQIKNPKILENRYKEKVCIEYDPILDNLSKEDIVTFKLDDSSMVKANKVFLCQNSDVFSAMLMGQFKESVEKHVTLKKVTKSALEYLLTLLHCGVNNSECEVKIFPMATQLEVNLEVLLLADRFLFEKLKERLTCAILQFLLTPENADKIYIWSMNDGMGFLCVESVAYLLTGRMCDSDRIHSFQNILTLEYKDQWLDDIKAMIMRQLQK